MGYHLKEPPRGEFGELSKIHEEAAELKDADEQGATLMVLQELSDLIGAIEGYLAKHHPTITLVDLIVMKDITARAFNDGTRGSRKIDDEENLFIKNYIRDTFVSEVTDYQDMMDRVEEARAEYRKQKSA